MTVLEFMTYIEENFNNTDEVQLVICKTDKNISLYFGVGYVTIKNSIMSYSKNIYTETSNFLPSNAPNIIVEFKDIIDDINTQIRKNKINKLNILSK